VLLRDDPMLAGASGGGAAAVVAAGASAAAGVLATGAGVVGVVVATFPVVAAEGAVSVREPTVAGLQVLGPDAQPVRRLAISEA